MAPECTCDPFAFAEDTPWKTTLHANDCPALCTCYFRSNGFLGRRGNVVHLPDCGWYSPPELPAPLPGQAKGARLLLSVFDEWELP